MGCFLLGFLYTPSLRKTFSSRTSMHHVGAFVGPEFVFLAASKTVPRMKNTEKNKCFVPFPAKNIYNPSHVPPAPCWGRVLGVTRVSRHAAVSAQSFEARLLTQMVRLPIPSWQDVSTSFVFWRPERGTWGVFWVHPIAREGEMEGPTKKNNHPLLVVSFETKVYSTTFPTKAAWLSRWFPNLSLRRCSFLIFLLRRHCCVCVVAPVSFLVLVPFFCRPFWGYLSVPFRLG